MERKILSLLIAAVMMHSLQACGSLVQDEYPQRLDPDLFTCVKSLRTNCNMVVANEAAKRLISPRQYLESIGFNCLPGPRLDCSILYSFRYYAIFSYDYQVVQYSIRITTAASEINTIKIKA